jgi:hypothetical protein
MSAEFHSESQRELAELMVAARMKFRIRMEKWKDSESKQRWILKHPMANASEKTAAAEWLRKFGWSEEQIRAVK